MGVCRPHLQIQTQFLNKKCHCFPHPFLDLASKNPYPFSDLTLYVIKHGICISVERSQRNKDEYVKFSWNDIFDLFLFFLTSYSPRLLGRKISSSDDHTLFQTKMFKIYTRFPTKTAEKLYPLGRHIPIYLI